jgi:hypothetical protein
MTILLDLKKESFFATPEDGERFFRYVREALASGQTPLLTWGNEDAFAALDLNAAKERLYEALAERLLGDPAKLAELEERLKLDREDWNPDDS